LACDDPISPYAILSHTWGADANEVTYEDLINGTRKDKPGYERISGFVKNRPDKMTCDIFGFTCCINRANYTKLSQAINMFSRGPIGNGYDSGNYTQMIPSEFITTFSSIFVIDY